MPTFQTTRYTFTGGSTLFFGCKTPEESTRKAGFEVCGQSLRLVFDWERITPSRHSLPVHECNIRRLCLAFIICIQAAFKLQVKGLLMWVRKKKQIYMHAYIHTYFRKTISGNQACGCTPGLKRII